MIVLWPGLQDALKVVATDPQILPSSAGKSVAFAVVGDRLGTLRMFKTGRYIAAQDSLQRATTNNMLGTRTRHKTKLHKTKLCSRPKTQQSQSDN